MANTKTVDKTRSRRPLERLVSGRPMQSYITISYEITGRKKPKIRKWRSETYVHEIDLTHGKKAPLFKKAH